MGRTLLLGLGCAFAAAACIGDIGDREGEITPPGSMPQSCEGGPQPGDAPIRRMTRFEYNSTVRDLLGDDTNPADGFGLHVSYTASGEATTHQVRDGDAVLIPYGYHSVSAPPRYDLYYLWAIAGDERKLAVFEDPAHRWVHQVNP